MERRFVLLDQELRDILAIEGKKKKRVNLSLFVSQNRIEITVYAMRFKRDSDRDPKWSGREW